MAYTITLKETREMHYMGYRYKAWYTTKKGVPFHKDFTTYEEMEDFNARAAECGTIFIKAKDIATRQDLEEV